MLSALSGASLVHDVGFLDCADIGSLSYLVLVDEIIGMTARVMRGVQVNADTIMLDLIEKVGPGGLFLSQSKSAALCRKEAWVPTVLDREPYTKWERNGSLSTEDVANAKVKKILETHQPKPLAPEMLEAIEKILVAAEEREKK